MFPPLPAVGGAGPASCGINLKSPRENATNVVDPPTTRALLEEVERLREVLEHIKIDAQEGRASCDATHKESNWLAAINRRAAVALNPKGGDDENG